MKSDNYIVFTPRVRDLATAIQAEFDNVARHEAIELALDRIMKPRPLPDSGCVQNKTGAWRISTENCP